MSPAFAAPKWYLEFSDDEPSEAVLRRTLALELITVEVPPSPTREGDTKEDVQLHVAVTESAAGYEVRVFDRGEYVGARPVSAAGSPAVVGRRIALAAVELIHQLAERRRREARALLRERELDRKIAEAIALEELERAPRLAARFESLVLLEGAYLLGPSLGLELNREMPLRLCASLGFAAGSVERPAARSPSSDSVAPASERWASVSAFEFAFDAGYVLDLGNGFETGLGARVGASVLHFGDGLETTPGSMEDESWTARFGVRLSPSYPLSRDVRLALTLDLGSLLRDVPISDGTRTSHLGGAFVGLGLGVSAMPHF